MSDLEIKQALQSNPYLSTEIKERLYSVVLKLQSKIKEVDINKLTKSLKTLKLGKLSKFERKGIYYYDVYRNIAYIDANKLEGNYDPDHIFMKVLLEMATSTNTYTGFNSDERLRALNLAYTEILANYVIGNEGTSDLEEEVFIANLLSHIVGKDTMFNSYFTNDGRSIIKAMLDVEVGL